MVRSKKSLRNLVQNQEKTDEEFDRWYYEEYLPEKLAEAELDVEEDRVEDLMEQFADDYDLTDMNVNDRLSLKQLAALTIEFEELSKLLSQARKDNQISRVQAIDRVLKNIITSISSISDDLNISRKARVKDKGETLDEYLPTILKKARSFLNERLAYIYCPECQMLVCNTWFTNWHNENHLELTCPREGCQHKFSVTSEELVNNRNKNVDGVLEV